jgi:hypothetical protein
MPIEFWIIFITIIVIAFLIVAYGSRQQKQKRLEMKAIDHFGIGTYVSGLSGKSATSTDCNITDKEFVFLSQYGDEVGRIPRDLVDMVYVEDHSQIQSRITATRMLTLGIFSVSARKKNTIEEYFLLIDWQNETGLRENTLFKFNGIVCHKLANTAAESFKKYILPRREIIKAGEKKCPFCAESIKAEAKICKHCKSALT